MWPPCTLSRQPGARFKPAVPSGLERGHDGVELALRYVLGQASQVLLEELRGRLFFSLYSYDECARSEGVGGGEGDGGSAATSLFDASAAELLPPGIDASTDTRLVVLGSGGYGKTCLMKKLAVLAASRDVDGMEAAAAARQERTAGRFPSNYGFFVCQCFLFSL